MLTKDEVDTLITLCNQKKTADFEAKCGAAMPKRLVPDYFGLTRAEINAVNRILADQKNLLVRSPPQCRIQEGTRMHFLASRR